jgi:hypothetical protein
MRKKLPDTLTQEGAEKLARQIESYWLSRGFAGIETRIERIVSQINGKDYGTYAVRSNLGPSGHPPKFRAAT